MNPVFNIESLVDDIAKEAEEMTGTWSIDYCKSLENKLKRMTQFQRDHFVHQLLLVAQKDSCEMKVKFKIAQLLSCLNSFFFKDIDSSIMNDKETVRDTINSITQPHQLAEPTIKLFSKLINLPEPKKKITPTLSDFQGVRLAAIPRSLSDKRAEAHTPRACSLKMFPFQIPSEN